MSDSSLKPPAPSTREAAPHLTDTHIRASKALMDPDFTPATLPDGVLLEMITLAYREHLADRLRETADELLRRLGHDAPVTVTHSQLYDLTARLEAVETRLAALEGAEQVPAQLPKLPKLADTAHDTSEDIFPSVTRPNESAPAGRFTRDVIHDVLMTALELSLSVEQPATTSVPILAETTADITGKQDPDDRVGGNRKKESDR